MRRLLQELRQVRYSRALRIADPGAAALDDGFDELTQLLTCPAGALRSTQSFNSSMPAEPVADPAEESFIVRLATLSWRLGTLAEKSGSPAAGRSLRNRIEALTSLVANRGVEVTDFSGRDFDSCEHWDEVISDALPQGAQPYIESMRTPRVRWNGRTLQRGVPVLADRKVNNLAGGAS